MNFMFKDLIHLFTHAGYFDSNGETVDRIEIYHSADRTDQVSLIIGFNPYSRDLLVEAIPEKYNVPVTLSLYHYQNSRQCLVVHVCDAKTEGVSKITGEACIDIFPGKITYQDEDFYTTTPGYEELKDKLVKYVEVYPDRINIDF